jgi:hypothetical protein
LSSGTSGQVRQAWQVVRTPEKHLKETSGKTKAEKRDDSNENFCTNGDWEVNIFNTFSIISYDMTASEELQTVARDC